PLLEGCDPAIEPRPARIETAADEQRLVAEAALDLERLPRAEDGRGPEARGHRAVRRNVVDLGLHVARVDPRAGAVGQAGIEPDPAVHHADPGDRPVERAAGALAGA